MWVNQAQAWDDGYCARPVLRISGAEEEILRVPRPGHAEKLPKGVIVPGIYIPHKGTSERIEALSLGDTGNKVIVVACREFFPEQFREEATLPFRLLRVGEKELEGGKYVFRSDIIVPVQSGSQVVMARCADCLVYLASVGPRAILGLPFFARHGLVVLPDPGCFALVEDLCRGGPWDEFDYKCPPQEARQSLHMAGSRKLERDVTSLEHDGQLCRPMQGSATISCVDDKNLNAHEVHRELVTVDISESLAQLQELQESSSCHDPLLGDSFREMATCEGAEMICFERGHNNPPEVCPNAVECSIPQVIGLIGIMLVGSLTAFNSSVVLPVKNSRGGAPSRWLSLKVIGHVDGPLLSPICLFAISGMSAIVLHAHFEKLGPGEWPKLPEQDTPPLSASHSCRATQGTSIEFLIDRILTVPEILRPDECPKDCEIPVTVIERWVQQLADPNLECAELDSQCESSPSSDEGSVGPDVPADEFMGRYGFLRDEEGLETVETLQVLAQQVETSSSISSRNLLGQGFDSRIPGNAWSCAHGRIQRIARKGVSFIGVRWQPSGERRGRQPRGRPYTHKCIRKDGSLWTRSIFTAFWIGLEMNFNPGATHLQIRARLPKSSALESAPGYGSTLLKVELQSRKV